MTIGARLKLIRKKNNLKLKEAGEIFDITAQTLSRYENGQRTPDNDFLETFGKYFKLSGDWLLYGEPPIYRAADLDRDIKESFLELSHLINSKEAPGIDIPENFLLLLKYMLKYPRVRQSIFQFFYLFQKPLIDEHPEFLEKV
jgi:transcriptional regulator with XRE-family HTH domain